MKYVDAKKLHNGDEVVIKYTGIPLYVVATKVIGRNVMVICDDGNTYHHSDIQ